MKQSLSELNWDQFHDLSNEEKVPFFSKDGRLYDCLIAQQFDRQFLDYIYHLTNIIRSISKSKEGSLFLRSLFPHKRAMLYFMQPSTRTYLSFKTACEILGIQTSDVRDSSISSEVKGETAEDTLRTFSSYFDAIIMRHPEEGMAEKAAWVLNNSERPVPVFNAGSGKDQHPTQALLDIYTLRRSLNGGLEGKTILLAGDLLRGRTVRSLAQLIAHFPNTKVILSSPEKFRMKEDVLNILREKNVDFEETNEFHSRLSEADAIYMTRVQDEHDNDGFKSESAYDDFSLNFEDLKDLKENCAILHPLPRRSELDPAIDSDPRAKYWRQERNGMWTRATLLAIILQGDKEILDYWRRLSRQVNHTAIPDSF